MQNTRVGWRILDQLRLLLQVESVVVSKAEQKHLSLRGLPLKCEEERRTEIKVFEHAFARYFGFDEKTGKPGGTFLGRLRDTPHGDQRIYERNAYKDTARLFMRGRKRRGILPEYILKAHRELHIQHRKALKASGVVTVTKPQRTGRIKTLDTAA